MIRRQHKTDDELRDVIEQDEEGKEDRKFWIGWSVVGCVGSVGGVQGRLVLQNARSHHL